MAVLCCNRRSDSLGILIGHASLPPAPFALHVASRRSERASRLPLKSARSNQLPLSFSRSTPAASDTIQHVGYVCVPHVCTSEPGPPEAQERGDGCLLPGRGGHCTDTLHGPTAGRNGQRDGRTSSGYPPGETPAAAAEPGEAARLRVCARFEHPVSSRRCWKGESGLIADRGRKAQPTRVVRVMKIEATSLTFPTSLCWKLASNVVYRSWRTVDVVFPV